jgi:hypothetical protein
VNVPLCGTTGLEPLVPELPPEPLELEAPLEPDDPLELEDPLEPEQAASAATAMVSSARAALADAPRLAGCDPWVIWRQPPCARRSSIPVYRE